MKKLGITTVALAMAFSASASMLTWGQWEVVEDWAGNDGSSTAYAMIYVLTAADAIPTFSNGAWNMNGATYLDTKAYDAGNGGWGDMDGADYGAVVSGTAPGAEQQYFAIFMTSESTSDLSTFVGDGKYYVSIPAIQGEQMPIPGAGTVSYYTDVSNFSAIGKGDWSQASAVPEPTTVALLALGLAAVGLKRKVA